MLKVGITGGIGSGKSWVARMFRILGIPVFNADDAAKYLMQSDARLKQDLMEAFGEDVYRNDRLDRSFLSSVVFNDTSKLAQLNALVHPAVRQYGREWFSIQQSAYAIKEAALFFESNSALEMNKMIGVAAPFEMRLQRAMQRDGVSEEEIRNRMNNQMDEAEKMKRCDFIIYNDESQSVIQQVLHLHDHLWQLAQTIQT